VQLCFENQVLDLTRRELLRDGKTIPVEPKTFDLLVYLVENRDRLVTKDDLIAKVWAGRIVSESAMASAINAARKAVGDSGQEQRLIRTSARRGFRFVGQVTAADRPHDTVSSSAEAPPPCDGDRDTPLEPSQPAFAPAVSARPMPERRQLTVLFVELVDSVAVSCTRDPEDLRELTVGCHQAVIDAIRIAGGFVAKVTSDGVLGYFGYPQAAEDSAERAVRAGLSAITSIRSIASGKAQMRSARVGIATGPVVIDKLVSEEMPGGTLVIGEPVTLATRLAAQGPMNRVVVAGSTRHLIGKLFGLEALRSGATEELAEPVPAFVVTSARQVRTRFEGMRGTQRTRLVGRDQELGLLLDRWQLAKSGDGQLVLLSGEPGIGKSRLVEAMQQKLTADAHHRILYQCSPQHVNSPFYPPLMQLAAASGLQPDDQASTQSAKLRAALPDSSEDQITLLAELLGIALPIGSPLINLAPARKRQLQLAAFIDHLEALCRKQSVLWVIEDAHWADPTTEDLISHVAARAGPLCLMIVVTYRPEYRPPWLAEPIATQIALSRFSRTNSGALLKALSGNKALPPTALDYISARADGVPLFMEELFQALHDSGVLRAADATYELTQALEGTVIPTTLHDSLLARLDRLGPAKVVAQLGAAIGRHFEYQLLSSIVDMSPDLLDRGLDQLVDAGLLFSRGASTDATYVFKHALVQEAAYGLMLRQRRQEVHSRIAGAMVKRHPADRPEVMAHHFEAAGGLREAANWFEIAGDVALQAAAIREAIRFWQRALGLLDANSAEEKIGRARIKLMQKLGSALIQVEGYGSSEAFDLGREALRLAAAVKDPELYVRVSTRSAPTLFARQDYARVERQLAQVSEPDLHAGSTVAKVLFWSVRGITNYHLGKFADARRDLSDAVCLTEHMKEGETHFGGGDVRVVARTYLSRAQLYFGLQDTAMVTAMDAVSLAREIADPFSVAWSLVTLGRASTLVGKYEDACQALSESIEICERYGFFYRLGHALIYQGVVRVAQDDAQQGALEIRKGLDLCRPLSGLFSLEMWLVEAADISRCCGHIGLARTLLEEAGQIYREGSERAGYAEYLRLKSLFAALDGNRDVARKTLREAIKVAEGQSANRFRLRACVDLARMMVVDGNITDARKLLGPVLAWFKEGLDAPDLVQARLLFGELGR
jgi:DNA-binding winged helix-turn-helix (wHTH) protein/tetratricopeptide (TPR) repeat protein